MSGEPGRAEQIEWWLVDLGPDKPVSGFWRSSREPLRPHQGSLPAGPTELTDTLDAFRRALSDLRAGSALADPTAEGSMARRMGAALLPRTLVEHCVTNGATGAAPPLLHVYAAGRVADIPWEAVSVDGDRRLVEFADIRMIPPPTQALPAATPPLADIEAGSACVILDPLLPELPGLGPLVDRAGSPPLAAMVASLGDDDIVSTPGSAFGRKRLSHALRRRPGRLLYFGHVSGDPDGHPERNALHLSDDPTTVAGHAPALPGHRPLWALDLMTGPTDAAPVFPAWPMPPRVALIGCGSGRELQDREPFGLVSVALATGARLVTATRWSLPTDHGMLPLTGPDTFPTSRLVAAVDKAHRAVDPGAALTAWRRDELGAWRAGHGLAHSPLLWGSLADFEDPGRLLRPPG